MYSIITSQKEIYNLQILFNNILTNDTNLLLSSLKFPKFHINSNRRWYSWNGLNYILDEDYINETNVWWSNKNKMWISIRKVKSTNTGLWRYWNAFGLENPNQKRNLSITAEINFPESGIDRNISGVFAKNNEGKIIVAHRGRFRKGSKNITFDYLVKNTNYQFININHYGEILKCLLVGELQSQKFFSQVSDFVKNIYELKN